MEAAVFCLCPPGQTQDTVRVWRSILKGCIPITLFRANDLPFARFLVRSLPPHKGNKSARGMERIPL